MMDASEGVPYRVAEPRAAKLVIESKDQLRGMLSRYSVINGELQDERNSIVSCLTGVLL
jgi:hypothetical protein